jgi:dTDP-4-amino-4,6-dideoxygalactose transaminase
VIERVTAAQHRARAYCSRESDAKRERAIPGVQRALERRLGQASGLQTRAARYSAHLQRDVQAEWLGETDATGCAEVSQARTANVPRMPVPLFDTQTCLDPLRGELDAAVKRVLDDGRYVLGPEVAAFENEFAAYTGVGHAVGVANGTDAITIALRAMGVGPGDEVVVPSFTFYASVEAIPPTGATPVFCDIDPETFCVTADTVRAALTPRTKAVVAVHLFGNVAAVREIEALGLPVLEDAAQAAGSIAPEGRPGGLGTAATFSFFPSKNLGCFGDGGAITTSDGELAERARVLRFHGSRDKVTYEEIGYNSRLDELQAAILRVQLPHLDVWADGRRAAGDHYAAAGLGELLALPRPVAGAKPAWHLFVVRHDRIEEVAAALGDAGHGNRAYYRTPVHRQRAMARYAAGVELPGTEEAARTHLAIPMSPVLTAEDAASVTEVVRTATPASHTARRRTARGTESAAQDVR